ncbi:MAG: hypothetical protein NWT00_00145 [Beijerinckiaceae bacterium]|jgi:hypothetical protein|nr:hypothetical protein [Beijerinckiaceae bacterium]
MTEAGTSADINLKEKTGHKQPSRTSRMFRAFIGRFDAARDREVMDDLTRWVEQTYREELEARPSKHVYVRNLPADVASKIDQLRDNDIVYTAVLEQFASGSVITPMKQTDELYISHYNRDYGGDHGLFSRHYDGNLRFMPVGAVVRSLIYLQSDATYKVVFGDSRVEKAFETYDFGILDFHKELHWVEGDFNPDDKQRILLKCNYLVAPKNAVWIARALLAANTGVFYVVKAAMEYSKSPKTPTQRVVGYGCNIMRLLNNIHPVVPLALIAALLALAAWGLVLLF